MPPERWAASCRGGVASPLGLLRTPAAPAQPSEGSSLSNQPPRSRSTFWATCRPLSVHVGVAVAPPCSLYSGDADNRELKHNNKYTYI